MKRILFSFTLLFAGVLAQGNTTWPDQPGKTTKPKDTLLPSVTCVAKGDQSYGNQWTGDYFNDWGKLQRQEKWNETLELRQIITCQNKQTRRIVGISGKAATVNTTNASAPVDIKVFPLGIAGNVITNADVTCTSMTLTQGEYIKNAGVKTDANGVVSIVFYTTGGQIYGTGSPGGQNDTVFVEFQANQQMIGFFGTNIEGVNMQSLGFLTYKEQCRKLNPSERALFITGSVFLFLGILLLVILCCCGVPICACCYIKRRRPDLMQKVKIPAALAKVMTKKTPEDRGKIVPDSSMAADIEMTDNNIEDKSAIMTEDAKIVAAKPTNEKPLPKGKGKK